MDVRCSRARSWARGLTATALLLAAGLAVAPAPAGAAGPAEVAQAEDLTEAPGLAGATSGAEAPTASDGSRLPAGTHTSLHGEAGFTGTGIPVDPKATAPSGDPGRGIGTESIFGPDNRVRVTPTTSFPARAIVMITRNGAAHCTGWLYGPDIVATAGHCVHSGGTGGSWYTGQLVVFPGRNGTATPYGSCTARKLYSVAGWTTSANEEFDYGAIKLNCQIGNTTGWLGYWWQSASLAGTRTLVNGYPGEKPFGQQWRGDSVSRTVVVSQANQIFYANDTTGGMSGSPVYQARAAGSPFCAGYCSMAIHTYGFPHGGYPHNTYNHGSRITQARFTNMQAWKAAP